MTWQSGGGSSLPNPLPGQELAYAQITHNVTITDTGGGAPIPGLSITLTGKVGAKYYIEFYCAELDENTGSTAGDLVTSSIGLDNVTVIETADIYQAAGGFGSAVFMKTPAQIGDGTAHTFDITVQNVTLGTSGALLVADGNFPAYIRAVAC